MPEPEQIELGCVDIFRDIVKVMLSTASKQRHFIHNIEVFAAAPIRL
jgi:ribosomal protein L13